MNFQYLKIKGRKDTAFTFIRFSTEQKEELRNAQKILKHSDITITIRYLIRNALKNKIWDK